MNRRNFGLFAGGTALVPAVARAAPPTGPILVVGDSLSAEYGLARGTGWVALLQQRLAQERGSRPVTVVNASISGDTTAGGRARLPALLREHRPGVVVIALGGNDALRGLPLAGSAENLRAMVQAARQAGARVLLVGIDVPPNYGSAYTRQLRATYAGVAQETHVPLVPSLLAGVADAADPVALFQPDRIHPLAVAQPRMLDNVWTALRRLLD